MDFNLAESALTIFIAGFLILFFAQFIPRKSKRTKKILLIAKISALIIFIAQSIFGFAYARYCKGAGARSNSMNRHFADD